MLVSVSAYGSQKKVAYLVSDIRIPFWSILAKGIESNANKLGYAFEAYSANNSKKTELQNAVKVIREKYDAIIVSPISSSTCSTILKLAQKASIPVVIADIGTDSGEYLSFIASDNFKGAYDLGKVLVAHFRSKGLSSASVGIVSIPQKRKNGQLRTQGFLKALNETAYIGGGLLEQVDFSYFETFGHTKKLLQRNSAIKAIWLQGSDRYKAALDAIKAMGKEGEVSLLTFDAEPEFLDLIPKGILVASGMQQPFLMGEKSMQSIDDHFHGKKVEKLQQLEVLAISTQNIKKNLSLIKRNVLGVE